MSASATFAHPDIVGESRSAAFVPRLRRPPRCELRLGGDVAGQGWGINPDDAGMSTFATMRKISPGFPAVIPATPSMPMASSSPK